ncbi:hypothetical protein RDABS01_027317 [Bienertia sinuspersici]
MGAIPRDNKGDVLIAMCDVRKRRCSTGLGEAMAMHKGIRIAMEVGFRAFTLESDCLAVYVIATPRPEAGN